MKSVKVIFALAGIALVGALGCFLAFIFVPGQPAQVDEESIVTEESPVEEETVEDLSKLAEAEVQRFFNTYGVEIPKEEMEKQLQIRKDYEETYGETYELEEVFLAETGTAEEGDPASEEYADTIEQIQKYLKKYNIDESRYASMTAQEELAALEVEYGPLTDEAEGLPEAEGTPAEQEDGEE